MSYAGEVRATPVARWGGTRAKRGYLEWAARPTALSRSLHPNPPPAAPGEGVRVKLTPRQLQMFVVIGVSVAMPMIAMLAVALVVVLLNLLAGE